MSSLVILPDDPVPGTWRRSRLFSRAILRTSGEDRRRSPVSVSAVSVSVSAAAAAGAGVAAGALGWAFAAATPPLTPITATTVLIWTVVPACTLISESTPAAGEGISASTLSVEISNSGSSCCTVSPTFLSHLVMVPSKIDSPIWGMITSVAIVESFSNCGHFRYAGRRTASVCQLDYIGLRGWNAGGSGPNWLAGQGCVLIAGTVHIGMGCIGRVDQVLDF